MDANFSKMLEGYQAFRKKYALGDTSVMQFLSLYGQQPQIMMVACCDSRVDPALILQCGPGELFVVRNVANIVPPYELDGSHHGTSAALEFGIRYLNVDHLILLGHSQCGGVQSLFREGAPMNDDFISSWVEIIKDKNLKTDDPDEYAKLALKLSYKNCLTFPWIKEAVDLQKLRIHLWFFDIKSGQIFTYSDELDDYKPLDAGDVASFST